MPDFSIAPDLGLVSSKIKANVCCLITKKMVQKNKRIVFQGIQRQNINFTCKNKEYLIRHKAYVTVHITSMLSEITRL